MNHRDPTFDAVARREEREGRRPSCQHCKHWTRLWGVVICKRHEGRVGSKVSKCSDFRENT